MTRARTAVAVFALLLALAACSSEGEPSAAPTANASAAAVAATSAAPTGPAPISDDATIRQICNSVADLGNAIDYDADRNLAAGRRAEAIVDPKFSLPGRDLVKAAGAGAAAPGSDTNLDIAKAQLDFLNACGDKYGDGPW